MSALALPVGFTGIGAGFFILNQPAQMVGSNITPGSFAL
jgi:hypothetical protein